MRYLFTCGGTAGHINPALSVAEKIKALDSDSEFLFIGAEGQMELELVPLSGYSIESVKVTNLSRGKTADAISHNIDTIKNAAVSIIKSKEIIRRFNPDAVIGTGGYVCFPVITAAHELHIPTFIHESNAVPGLTTKLLSKNVDAVMLGFEDSIEYYRNSKKVLFTGTPVREEFSSLTKEEARKELGIPVGLPLVLSVWGSLGSGFMNETVRNIVDLVEPGSMKIIHSTGKKYFSDFSGVINSDKEQITSDTIVIKDYLYDIPKLMIAADLVLCRAGASTLSELSYLGKPALIVPSPNVTNNHQEKNARLLEKNGAAAVLTEDEITPESFVEAVTGLINDRKRLDTMGENMLKLGNKESAEIIASFILSAVR